MSDATLAKLGIMRNLVRRLTKSPSEAQLSTTEIDNNINSVALYDMPANVTLSSLKTVLRFYTEPNVGTYSTNTTDPDDPLYNFKNVCVVASNTVYVSGNMSYFTESRSDFFQKYPRTITSKSVETGDGAETIFSGTLVAVPILSGNVIFATIDLNGFHRRLYDDGEGILGGDGTGTINYVTGEYILGFNNAPADGEEIYAQTCTYKASTPTSVLFFNNSFSLRPIPNKCYTVEVEVYKRPTELIDSTDIPELAQWFEYIAYGAARKILMGRADFDTASILEHEMENKRDGVLYKSIIQSSLKEGHGL